MRCDMVVYIKFKLNFFQFDDNSRNAKFFLGGTEKLDMVRSYSGLKI